MKFCGTCGTEMKDDDLFCGKCGTTAGQAPPKQQQTPRQDAAPPPPPQAPPAQTAYAPQPIPAYPNTAPLQQTAPAAKKSPLVMLIVYLLLIVLSATGTYFLINSRYSSKDTKLPTREITLDEQMSEYFGKKMPQKATFTYLDVIYPANYESYPNLIVLDAVSPKTITALLTVEIPGVTQKYEQKIEIGPLGVYMPVLPALLDNIFGTTNTSKTSQLHVTLTDLSDGHIILNDTKSVQVQSMYDFQIYEDAPAAFSYRHIGAWVTPEDPMIREWQRVATDYLRDLTDGQLDAFIGYQGNDQITLLELQALYDCMRMHYKVRYNMTPLSTSKDGFQRIMLPADVLKVGSGLCIETAASMAAAAETMFMNAYVIYVPGHALTVVELMPDTNRYVLIETTALTATDYNDIFVFIGDGNQMINYIDQNYSLIAVVNVQKVHRDGFRPMS